jgi:pyruvate-formate lyase-activating enzyme
MKCQLVEQGYKVGSCLIHTKKSLKKACDASIKQKDDQWFRLIKSSHLSRPEHYFSVYQSGCNHHCAKCHSWEFTQNVAGTWISAKEIGVMAQEYEKKVTVWEPRERATMWHATDLCRSCASCVISGKKSELCPSTLEPHDIVLSPQGFGPARNIFAFTGGDLTCCVDFYCQAAAEIKKQCNNMLILLETNGYGLTPQNLDRLQESGVDAYWLDIKAYDEEIYRKLCGTTNEWILKAPSEIKKRGFVLEVLTLLIPECVDGDEIKKIARLIYEIDPDIPLTILSFFPVYKLDSANPPALLDMIKVFHQVKEIGLNHVKLGNCGVIAKNDKDWELLLNEIGVHGIG